MNQPGDAYTVVIFRGAKASPLRFSFARATVRRAIIVGVCLIVAELVILSQYVIRTGEVWELRALRDELAVVREQTNAFSVSVEDLKRRFLAMKEVNQRLRVMLGIEALKPEDYLNGQGGEETPIVQGEAGNAANMLKEGAQAPEAKPSDDKLFEEKNLTLRVQKEISWLQNEANSQERTLEEMKEVANAKSARWDSTPSIWPVKGWVTSSFGPRISPFTGQLAMHDGLDIGSPPNAPIQAPAAGRVTATGFDSKMGNMVRIEHGYGFETQYAHLAKVLVKTGQKVKRGDILGLIGSTGLSTGPHLHYLVKVKNQTVNPQRYILD
ncbi:MAG: M23 family metallopeptidase [Nitrospirae bacterium]|nr:M23 family metallopeptidase [Nitrospirota bacterium]